MLHTYRELYKECQKNGLTDFPEDFVPEKFNGVLKFYWDGGAIHPVNVLGFMLNGWFHEMETYMKTGRLKIISKDSIYSLNQKWKTTRNVIDDGTSDEVFVGILENAKAHKEKWENERKRKAEQRKQRKNYKTIRLLKKDIPEILSLIENHCSDNELIERFQMACKK